MVERSIMPEMQLYPLSANSGHAEIRYANAMVYRILSVRLILYLTPIEPFNSICAGRNAECS